MISSSFNHYIVAPVSNFVCRTCSGINKGRLYVCEGLCNMAYDVYDLKNEGFEKWVKASISNLRMLSIMNGMTDRFNIAINTFEAQKDLYYATKFIGSITHFIREKPAAGESRLQCPTFVQGLYAVANFFETGKFLQKNQVFGMKWASDFASKLGAFPLSRLGINVDKIPVVGGWLGWKTFEEVPVFGSLTRTPKDFFIFIASSYEVCSMIYKSVHIMDGGTTIERAARRCDYVFNLANSLKFISSAGKIVLISCGRSYSRSHWFAVADLITQNASLFKFWLDQSGKRQKRFEHPAAAARAA